MPEHLRSLFVILFLSAAFFFFYQRPICEIFSRANFIRRRNVWFLFTIGAFLAHNIWIYFLLVIATLVIVRKRENNLIALYFISIFAVPVAYVQIPGMGLVNYLFDISHQRLLNLIILFPIFLILVTQKRERLSGINLADKLLGGYLFLIIILSLREGSLTSSLRFAFIQFVDIFLPYYVISRSLSSLPDIREALFGLVMVSMILAIIGAFEISRSWLLYNSLIDSLGVTNAMTGYLGRGGLLRAVATTSQSIALGFVMAVSIGLFLCLQKNISSRLYRWLGFAILVLGLIVSLARGPLLGAILSVIVFVTLGKQPLKNLLLFGITTTVAFAAFALTPGGEKYLSTLPFIGHVEQGSISYRLQLINNSWITIERNLLFGSINYLDTPEMQAMRQGQGIIDVVNSYIGIALAYGTVGLVLFVGFFISLCFGIRKSLKSIKDKSSEAYLLGRSLLATLLGILLIIFTVSSITVIPIVYWSFAGVCAAYIQVVITEQSVYGNQDQTLRPAETSI